MKSNTVLRIIDSGVLEGRRNIAMGQALIDAHVEGKAPDTLRFLRFPPTALIGRHQDLGKEVNVDYCKSQGIGLARRITGGGAIYLDPGQLGWELVIHRSRLAAPDLGSIAAEICTAVAESLSTLGVAARYRPRNDIEVEGRKISGTGGFFEEDTLFFQGTVLVDLDPSKMVAALRVPRVKLEKHDLDSAAQRVVTLGALLGNDCPDLPTIQRALSQGLAARFGLVAEAGEFHEEESKRAQSLYEEEIGLDEFLDEINHPGADQGTLEGEHTGPGGSVRSYVSLQGAGQQRFSSVLISGDFFVTPPRVVYDLEGALRGSAVADLEPTIVGFFERTSVDMLSVSPADFVSSIRAALNTS